MSNEDKGLLKQMETDSQLHKVKDIDVDEIANLCQSAADLQRECDELEQQLKNKRQKAKKSKNRLRIYTNKGVMIYNYKTQP